MPFSELKFTEGAKPLDFEKLHINFRDKAITAHISGFQYIDKDTKQHVRYIPSLEISGYGESAKEADYMINESVEEFMKFLIDSGPFRTRIELSKFGWKPEKFFSKRYSKPAATLAEQLPNLNADLDSIVRITMVA